MKTLLSRILKAVPCSGMYIKGWNIVDGSGSSSSRPSKEASNRACLRMTMNCAAIVIPVGPGCPANFCGVSSIAQQKQAIIIGSTYFSGIRLFLIANKMLAQVKEAPTYIFFKFLSIFNFIFSCNRQVILHNFIYQSYMLCDSMITASSNSLFCAI